MEGEEREEGVGALFSLLLDDEPAVGGEERRGEEKSGRRRESKQDFGIFNIIGLFSLFKMNNNVQNGSG